MTAGSEPQPDTAPAEEPGRRGLLSRPLVIVALVALAGAALLVVLFVPLGGSDGNEGSTPLLGKAAPDFELATLDGGQVRLSELRGQPVIINFWATWCIPCREEFPLLADAYADHAEDGLEILGIVHDDTDDGARRFAADHDADWPMLVDRDDAVWDDYLGVGLPMSFFIDGEGIVRAFSLGGFTEDGLEQLIGDIVPAAA